MSNYNAIYLSPHLDDVTLSCGGQIYQRTQAGEKVLIVSVTAGDPAETAVSTYAQSLHERWELISDSVAGRREEDKAACHILGADYWHWDVLDCIYRLDAQKGTPFYTSDEALFGSVHAIDEAHLLPYLSQQMQQLPQTNELFVPLGAGNHVDHQLVRMVSEATFSQQLIYYYEDYPYASVPNSVETVIAEDRNGWRCKILTLTARDIEARISAIVAFNSQLSTFFKDRADLEQQIKSFVSEVGGERIWYKRSEK